MSYDVRFAVQTVKADRYGDKYAVVCVPEYDSPTYNLREMFVACMDWDYHQGEWYPSDVFMPAIERGIHELTLNPDKYRKYNPSNGWGTLEGALKALCNWYEELTDEFEGVTCKWNLEDVWMRW